MAEQSLSECIDDLLECPICLECMADPRLLPCKQGHSFCDKCVHRLAISSLSLTTAACPLCRQEVPISDSGIIFTTRDITRAKLLDTNKRCEGNKQYCSKHSTERVRRFCKQCRVYVCCDCLVEGLHADHLSAVVGIGEAEEEMHTLLSQIGAKAFEQVKRLNAYRQDFINASKAEKEKLRLQVDKRLQELSDQLQADKQRLYNKIDNYVPSDVDPSVSVTHEQLQTLTEDVTGSLQVWTSLEEQCALYDRATSLWEGISDVTLPPIHTSGIVRFVEVASVPCAGDIIPCQDNLRTSASNATQISRKRPPRPPPPEKSKTDVLGNSSATSLSSDAVVKAKNASALISERDQEPTVSPAAASISRTELRLSQPASQRQSTTAMRNTEDFNVTRRKQQNTNRPISTGLPITSRRGDVNRLSAVCDTPDHDLTGRLCRHKSVGQLETKTSGCLLM